MSIMSEPYFITARALAERGRDEMPAQSVPSKALIYSSPATLSYNSPGANGFGVKRAGLVIPESVMLLVSPGCCGRNSTILSAEGGYSERMFYLRMDETDLVTGRHLEKIPQAVREIIEVPEKRPKVVLICITCVDALLGTDLERVCRKAEEYAGVRVVPSYMYALTREGTKPPMAAIRESVYSVVEKRKTDPHAVNLLGFFAPLDDECEIYKMFPAAGLTHIREMSRETSYESCLRMGEANFNLLLNPEARSAAEDMMQRLGMPYIELTRSYDADVIARQYKLLGAAIGVEFSDGEYRAEAEAEADSFRRDYSGLKIALGQTVNANPFELAASLAHLGIVTERIFSNYAADDYLYIQQLACLSPDTRLYTGISPTMALYRPEGGADLTIGRDAAWYYPKAPNLPFCSDRQSFGYRGLVKLLRGMREELESGGQQV